MVIAPYVTRRRGNVAKKFLLGNGKTNERAVIYALPRQWFMSRLPAPHMKRCVAVYTGLVPSTHACFKACEHNASQAR